MKKIYLLTILLTPFVTYAVRDIRGSIWNQVTERVTQELAALEPGIKKENIKLVTQAGQPETIGILVTGKSSELSSSALSKAENSLYLSIQDFLIQVGPNIPLSPKQSKKIQLQKVQYLKSKQLESIKALYYQLLLLTYEIDPQSNEKGLATLINAINAKYSKNDVAPRIVIIAYGENAPVVNQAIRLLATDKPISLLIYVQSPIYEYEWGLKSGYKNVPAQTPQNFLKLINIYTKAENPAFNVVWYPDRKYRAQVSTTNNQFNNRVVNVNGIKINKDGQLTNLQVKDFSTLSFFNNLSWLIEQLKQYRLNFDLTTLFWDEERGMSKEGKSVFINRFVSLDKNDDLIMKYGDGSSQKYVLISAKELSPQLLEDVKKQFSKELELSWAQLRNIFDKSAVEGWVPSYFGGSSLAKDIADIKSRHLKEFNSSLMPKQIPHDLLLNNKDNELELLLKKLDNPVSLNYAITHIISGGNYLFKLLFNPDNKINIPTKTQEEYLQSIISLIWYLYGEAINKKQGFTEGTFVIEDKNFKLYDFLIGYVKKVNPEITGTITDPASASANNPFAYSRISSHYKAEQKLYRQYGIDIRFDKKSEALPLLPSGKRHLVFGKIDEKRNLIFIKPENYGIYTTHEKAMHGYEFVHAQGVKLLPKMKFLLSDPLYKTFQDLIGTDDDPLYRKERVPQEFIVAFAEVIKPICTTDKIRKEHIAFALRKGIQYSVSGKVPPNVVSLLRQQLDAAYDYLYFRTGREVILTYDELSSSLYYYLVANKLKDSKQVKELFDLINEAKNTIFELKKAKLEQRNFLNLTIPPINILLKKLRDINTKLSSINLEFLSQFSPIIYQYVTQVQIRLNTLLKEKEQIAFTALTGLGTLFDSRLWQYK